MLNVNNWKSKLASNKQKRVSVIILYLLMVGIMMTITTATSGASNTPPVNSRNMDVINADGGDFSINFAASAPLTYDHSTGGGAFNDGTNSESGDIREELQGGDFTCGDNITYLSKITVDASTTGVNQTIELDYSFLTETTGQPGASHVKVTNVAINYGQVENGDNHSGTNPGAGKVGLDSGVNDDRQSELNGDSGVGGSSATNISETIVNDELLLTVRIDDMEAGEVVILRIDVQIDCTPGSKPTGNLQGRLEAGRVIEIDTNPTNDAISSGAQTINFKQVGNINGVGEPLLTLSKKVTAANGTCDNSAALLDVGSTPVPFDVKYCIILKNSGTETLFDVEITDDNSTPADTDDDFIVSLVGLEDLDGEADLGDLAAGATVTAEYTITITTQELHINTATAQGTNGQSGPQLEVLSELDLAEVNALFPTTISLGSMNIHQMADYYWFAMFTLLFGWTAIVVMRRSQTQR